MAGSAILKLQVIADASRAVSSLHDLGNATDSAGKQTETMGSKLKTMGLTALKVAGVAALGGLVAVIKTGVSEQSDFLAGQAQLQAGIKSTGNAAHVSVKGMESLASSIQNYSGQTDDSIVSAEKLMLTFTNVQNHAGPMNDIFNQSIKLTADMAARMGGDASQYAIQLGKALNDPVKGLTSLTRIGVSFTEQQKKQVTALSESGHTMAAQKIIIAELNKEFGGSAKAFGDTLPGQIERTKRAFEDVSQQVVSALMPIMQQLADFLLRDLMPAFSKLVGFVSHNMSWLGPLAAGIAIVVVAMKALSFATVSLGIAMDTLPIIGWISAIVAVGVALVALYNKCAWFRSFVQAVFRIIIAAAKLWWQSWVLAFNIVKKIVTTAGRVIIKGIQAVWRAIVVTAKTIFKIYTTPYVLTWRFLKNLITKWAPQIFSWIKNIVVRGAQALSNLFDRITGPFKKAWDWLTGHVRGWASTIAGWVRNIAERVYNALGNLFDHIVSPFQRAWQWLSSHVSGWAGSVGTWISRIASRAGSALSGVMNAITGPFRDAWSWLSSHVSGWASGIWNWLSGVAGRIGSALSGVYNAIISPFQSAYNWVNSHVIGPLKSAWNGFANVINSVHITLPKIKVPFGPTIGGQTIGFPHIPTFRRGAFLTGPTLAVAGEAGPEWVLPDAKLRAMLRAELQNLGPTVIIQGALDPDAVARQVERILIGRSRRVSGITQSGTAHL